jgi:hypothetical protein
VAQEHTPGPWFISAVEDDYEIIGPNERHGTICTLYRHNWPDGVDTANARLIAAAPALLDALKAALPFIPHTAEGFYDVLHPAFSQARAALAKAEGCAP